MHTTLKYNFITSSKYKKNFDCHYKIIHIQKIDIPFCKKKNISKLDCVLHISVFRVVLCFNHI